jgi:hypothetical protein
LVSSIERTDLNNQIEIDMAPETLPILFFGSLLLTGLNVYLAERKGRQKEAWFFITLFLGIFATGLLLLADKVDQQPTGDVKA